MSYDFRYKLHTSLTASQEDLLELIRGQNMTNAKEVDSETVAKASAKLQEQIEKELLKPDPAKEKAEGIIREAK